VTESKSRPKPNPPLDSRRHRKSAVAQGTVTVTLKRVPGELRLTVADNGQGLDPRRADSGLGRKLVDGFAQQLGCRSRKLDPAGV